MNNYYITKVVILYDYGGHDSYIGPCNSFILHSEFL